MMLFGLLGKKLGHSFSRKYFLEKFANDNIREADYNFFEIDDIRSFPEILNIFPKLKGLNVTLPYKTSIIPYLNKLDDRARRVGAVNTIEFFEDGQTKGWNTDYIGFRDSLLPILKPQHTTALIFGDGGASKAVEIVLRDMMIAYQVVSRKGLLRYDMVDEKLIASHQLLINCTPLGMFPKVNDCIDIPYQAITPNHLLYDLVYNPEETLFMKKGQEQGAEVKNGHEMLHLQAEAAWEIWMK